MAPALAHAAPPPAPADLTIADAVRPLAASSKPQFGWQVASDRGADRQTGYEIRVTRARDGVEVWDSGKVDSPEQAYVDYRGPSLARGASYLWTVRRWDAQGEASAWAAAQSFDVAIGDADWSGASWIRRATAAGPDSADDYTLARKEFAVTASPVTRARVYATGMAQYEVHLGGKRVVRGDSFGYPGEGQFSTTDVTDDVVAGQPLAVGLSEHYWTCTCQGRANGPQSNTTLAAPATAGDTTLKVASVGVFDVGDPIEVGPTGSTERATITAIGTAGAAGTGITISAPLAASAASAAAVRSLTGPTGMLAKVVVDHADGSRQTFVSDGSWKVAKDTAYLNATVIRRNGDAGDVAEQYDARAERTGWDTAGYDASGWQDPIVIGPHPRPVNPLRDTFSHLDPAVATLKYETLRPKTVRTLDDGTVVADFGRIVTAVPQITLREGVSGRVLSSRMSFRNNNTRLAADVAAGATTVPVASVANFQVGDAVTIDAPAANQGPGDPESRTITAVGAAGAGGPGLTLDRPLDRAHASGAWTEGSRAGTSSMDTQGSNMSWSYTAKSGEQTARGYTYFGWRYLEISAPGEPLTAADIGAVEQSDEVPAGRRASFASDNPTLDGVFDLMQRSGELSTQETYLDTPTREKAGFLGDGIDISWANMTALGERGATIRAMREAIASGLHTWKNASNGYCLAGQVPCSYSSLGTPGRLNSVYPNGDNMRDIPDYTLAFPDWVWRYYLMTGDKRMLADSYPTLKAIASYIHGAQPTDGGPVDGLVFQLPGGTGPYANGIIDWPAPMRYGYTFEKNGARTIHNAESVGAYDATAKAAAVLGNAEDSAQYDAWKVALGDAMNAKLVLPNGLYSDGRSTDPGNALIENSAQHAQTYPIYFGVAPRSTWPVLADEIVRQGMHQGPMTWHVLLAALADAGREDQVVKLMTDAKADGPARTLAENGSFMWEQWSPSCSVSPCVDRTQSNNESQSHGWGAMAIVDMVEELVGVQVTAPGAASVTIAPPQLATAALRHVRGSAWTQRGTVGVDWTQTEKGMRVIVDVPANVETQVRIPNPDGITFAARGEGGATYVRDEDGVAVFTVGSGRTTFAPQEAQTPTPTPGAGNGSPGNGEGTPPGVPPTPGQATPPPAGGAPAADKVRPKLSGVRRLGAVKVRSAVRLRVTVSEPGKLRMSLSRLVPGRRSGGRCVARKSGDTRRSTCTARTRAAAPAASTLRQGTQTVRVGTSRLRPGRYRLVVTAADAAGNRSGSHMVAFTVVR